MTRRFMGALAATTAALGMFAATAGASGYSSGHTTNSYSSPTGGSCFAATQTAGYHGNSAPMQFWPYITYCGEVG
jgi:hypothetical protein